jgi:hypothetical protein
MKFLSNILTALLLWVIGYRIYYLLESSLELNSSDYLFIIFVLILVRQFVEILISQNNAGKSLANRGAANG